MKKVFTIIIAMVLILLVVIGVTYRYAENNDFFFPQISQQLQEKTGFVFAKTGALELSLLPRPELTVRELKISNPSRQADAQLLSVKMLSLALDWQSILRADITLNVHLDGTEVDLQIDDKGRPNWQTSQQQGDNAELPFRLGELNARLTRFRFRNHQTQEILGLDFDQIDIDFENGQLNTHISSAGRYGDTLFIALGELNYETKSRQLEMDVDIRASAARNNIKVDAIEIPSIGHWIEQNAASFPVSGNIQGEILIKENLPRGELRFEYTAATIGDISYLSEQLTHIKPELGPFVASGTLRLNGSDIDISKLRAKLINPGQLQLEISGEIQNLLSVTKTELTITGQANRLDQLFISSPVSVIDQALISRMEAIELTAFVTGHGSGTRISDIDLHFRHRDLNARVMGEFETAEGSIMSKLTIDGRTVKASDLFEIFNITYDELDQTGPFTLKAQIRVENNRYYVEQSEFSTQDGNIKAVISGELNASSMPLSFDLDSQLNVKDFSQMTAIFPIAYQPYVQSVGGSVQAKLQGTRENFSASNLTLDLLKADRTLSLTGELSHLPTDPTSNVHFQYSIVKPLDLDQYFPKLGNLQLSGPLKLAGTLQIGGNTIRIEQLKLLADKTDINGTIDIDLGLEPARVNVALNAEQFTSGLAHEEPNPEIPIPEPSVVTEAPVEKELSAKQQRERFEAYISDIQINTDWIDQLDLYFDFKAANAQIGAYNGKDLALAIDAREGIFKLLRYELMLDGKPVSFTGEIDTSRYPPAYTVTGELHGDTLEALLNAEDDLLQGGELNGRFSLISEGINLGELIANLNGKALVTMGPLTIKSNAIDFVSSSIFSVMLGGLMSKKQDTPSTTYECGVMGVEVKNGVLSMDRSFTLQAQDYNLAGHGKIDLNSGMVNIKVQPRARKGLGLSVSTLVGGFKVKGNLATPQFGLGNGLVSAAVVGYTLSPVALGAAVNPATATIVATGFILTGVASRMTSANFTCDNTLKRIERKRLEKTSPVFKPVQKQFF